MESLPQRIGSLERRLEAQGQELEALKKENARLRHALEEALRAGKRQAAPFSRQEPKAAPRKPGRKAGKKYGRRCRRPIPKKIDEVVEVPLPECCPQCGGAAAETEVVSQYQSEIPEPRVEWIEFRIHVGCCRDCGRRVQGRHPRQSSDAIGGAASQLGARAVALATQLNKGLGLPYGKTAAVLEEAFGLHVSRGGLCQALARVADKAEPTYRALVEQIRRSRSVTPDETGWKVGGRLWWMWAFSSAEATVYTIEPGRGFAPAAKILGADFDGFLVRDGWAVYRQFVHALHQSCLAHLLRRCEEMILVAGGKATFPRTVQAILQAALQLRDRREQGELSERGLAIVRGRLESCLDRSLCRSYRTLGNRRLAKHLLRERDVLFTFLDCPGLEATNWRAEQAIRPMVVTRKVWGGNRTVTGARTQSILVSILQTCRQQFRPASSVIQRIFCLSKPRVFHLTARRR